MGKARKAWDAAKHPRGEHGHFGYAVGTRVTVIPGKKPRKATRWEAKRYLAGHDLGHMTTRAFHPRGHRARTKLTQYSPGVASTTDGYRDVRVKSVYSDSAAFKQVGYAIQPAGYFRDYESRAKDRRKRARHMMGAG